MLSSVESLDRTVWPLTPWLVNVEVIGLSKGQLNEVWSNSCSCWGLTAGWKCKQHVRRGFKALDLLHGCSIFSIWVYHIVLTDQQDIKDSLSSISHSRFMFILEKCIMHKKIFKCFCMLQQFKYCMKQTFGTHTNTLTSVTLRSSAMQWLVLMMIWVDW